MARIQDAVNAVDATIAPYGVTITEVSDPAQANVTLNMGTNSAAGNYAQGVLGCYTTTGTITLIQGWNWYAGSDPTQIASNQYDFQTTVTHELGHALGLGESSDPTSAMYGTLSPGTAVRTLTTADLNIPYDEGNADAQRAAVLPSAIRDPLSAVRQEQNADSGQRMAESGWVDPAFAVADLGWLQTWAWLMLGLGEDPNRVSGPPNLEPDAISTSSDSPSQPAFNQSAAGLGSNRKGTLSAGNPSKVGELLSESGSNPGPALEDDDDSAEDSGEPDIREEPPDTAVVDQFFQQSSDGADGGLAGV